MSGSVVELPPAATAPAGSAYAAIPDRPKRGMVVLHEIFGPQPEINRVVDRFAEQGYAAVAPRIFDSAFSVTCLSQALRTISTGQGPFVDRIRGARTWLCAQTGLREDQVGLIGFCMGGGFALAAGSGWAAVSTNYGDIPKPEIMKGIGPVIGCYGGYDRIFGKAGTKLKRALEPSGVEVETHVYPNVGHSFLTDGDHPVAAALSRPFFRVIYDPATAEDAWKHILGFMDRHLPV